MQVISKLEEKTQFFLKLIDKSTGPHIKKIIESETDYIQTKNICLGDHQVSLKEKKLTAEERKQILHEKQKEVLIKLCQKKDIDPNFIESLLDKFSIKEKEWNTIDLIEKKLSNNPRNNLENTKKIIQFILIMQFSEDFPSTYHNVLEFF